MSLSSYAVVTLALVSVVVVGGSRGVLSRTTNDVASSSTADAVVVTDDDAGSAMFSMHGMTPTDSLERCIVTTYGGDVTPADVSLYGISGGTGLDAYLDLTIEEGTGGTFADCTGFAANSTPFSGTLADFAATHTNFGSGLRAWSPTSSPESHSYRFTVTLKDDNAAQGLDATASFFWEALNQQHD